MNKEEIISKMNALLQKSAAALAGWLGGILPKTADTWWDDCVLSSLNYAQREKAEKEAIADLAGFDFAALLRIADKSWYDILTVVALQPSNREAIRVMENVQNRWAHHTIDWSGKDKVLADLQIVHRFLKLFGEEQKTLDEISTFSKQVEDADEVDWQQKGDEFGLKTVPEKKEQTATIPVNSMVYLTASPETKGIVLSAREIGDMTEYQVFVNNSLQTFYSGQIALVATNTSYRWTSIQNVRNRLTAYQINQPSSQNLYSLYSARIDFVPYQFRPALKLIHADEPRILIADSVGVGKTIEAGLIIKELEARRELERVLIICPKPLVAERKWETEMRRFDEEFEPVDGQTLRQYISEMHRDGEWPARGSKIVIPYSILDEKTYQGEKQKLTRSFGLRELDPEPHFDLVIVDEAHHIRSGSMEKEKAFAYKCTKYFCDHADAVVMLTATPLQTSDDDLFTLLNVLRPDVVIDKQTFEMMTEPNAYISSAARLIRSAGENWETAARQALLKLRKTLWGNRVTAENPLYDDILLRLGQEGMSRQDRVKLISDVESLHSFNTILNRTRRRDIQDFCVRRSQTVSTQFTDYQRNLHDELLDFEAKSLEILHNSRSVAFMMSTIKRQAASCIFGLAPFIRDILSKRIREMNDDPEVEYDWYDMEGKSADAISSQAKRVLELTDHLPDEDPKFDSIMEIIRRKQEQQNNKIMLFSTYRHTLAYLRGKLTEQGLRVAQIDGSIKDAERTMLKMRFEMPKEKQEALDILLFTEVGSEGLDYQSCNMMINYDLPWNPMAIEQRIGRIDRRGQQSETVNIYNVITEGTVDAEIYYRCLLRIGVFENSIGECEKILSEITSEIHELVLDTRLTDSERAEKLEQIADNEIRKVQELNRLEEEEKELFGFDLTEFTTSQEIRQAENPWLTPNSLQNLIGQYIQERTGTVSAISGESAMKNLRLSASARGILREDLRAMPGARNSLRQKWDQYLGGKTPNHSLTFEPDAAMIAPDSFFITAMHPLAKQAAAYFNRSETDHLRLLYTTNEIPAGTYPFSAYAWRYMGFRTYTKIVTVCDEPSIENSLSDILETAVDLKPGKTTGYDWSALESRHAQVWKQAKAAHRQETDAVVTFRLESLENNRRNQVRAVEQRLNNAADEAIRRMYLSELETIQEKHDMKADNVRKTAARADIYCTLLVNGVLTVEGER